MSPWDVLGWILVYFIGALAFMFVAVMVASLIRSTRKPKDRGTRIYSTGDRRE